MRKKKLHVEFCTIYFVTREYGGPEEGGWYYDWYRLVKTFPRIKEQSNNEDLISRLARFMNFYEGLRVGLGSVLSEGEYRGLLENHLGEFESKERPYYS